MFKSIPFELKTMVGREIDNVEETSFGLRLWLSDGRKVVIWMTNDNDIVVEQEIA